MKTITLDIEGSGLLDETTVDYTASPWKLKPNFKIHCVTVEEHDTGEIICFYDAPTYVFDGRAYKEEVEGVAYSLEEYIPLTYTHKPLQELKEYLASVDSIVAHNGVTYDFLVLKVAMGIDFTVCPDTLMGKPVVFEDTLIWSKTLNPDRYGGHSLDAWGERVGTPKIKLRYHLPFADRFKHFAADMLYYNIFDVKANTATYRHICVERSGWDWREAITTEKQVAYIVSNQQHRGFWFDRELALNNVRDLDELMAERKAKIDPILPHKDITKGEAKEYTPPKKQLKLNLELTSYMEKFVQKHNGKLLTLEGKPAVEFFGKTYTLPLPTDESLIKKVPATIDDTTHIKGWLVSLGWVPSEYSERDLSTNAKKEKLSKQKYQETVERYVEQTLACPFRDQRCDILGVTPDSLLTTLLNKKTGRAVKVPTNPKFTVGQEKELCPKLSELEDTFPFAKDIVEYLTYRHRRNSILGGGVGWDDEEEEMEKGFLSQVREDGRIPTPADTCGCATSRFKHKGVANIPRCSSLYGHNMRAMFGTDSDFLLMGYDFDSLEARIEAHYCYRYDLTEGKDYCQSLILPKPHDVHTRTAQAISKVLGKEFGRTPAKSVKYASSYGAQVAKLAKTIGCDLATAEIVYNTFWEAAAPLKSLMTALEAYWNKTGEKKFILGIDGRKVPTRAKHALVNSLFQSAGVICAKKAMILHDQKLRREGLIVDFWKDDWKNKIFTQQLIAYHN